MSLPYLHLPDNIGQYVSPNTGMLPASELESVPGIGIFQRTAARSLRAMQAHAKRDGIDIACVGDYRSYEAQKSLFLSRYRLGYTGSRNDRYWSSTHGGPNSWYHLVSGASAAQPGTSNHGHGLASDFAIRVPTGINTFRIVNLETDPDGGGPVTSLWNWLRWNGRTYGWYWGENPTENWHWVYCDGNAIPAAVLAFEGNGGQQSLDEKFGLDPSVGKWGLYPYQSWRDKPGVLIGMRDSDTRPVANGGYIFYAQSAVKYKMQQPQMVIDGIWGPASALYLAAKIMDWNKFTGDNLNHNNGNIGLDQWRFIDAYVKDFQNLVP